MPQSMMEKFRVALRGIDRIRRLNKNGYIAPLLEATRNNLWNAFAIYTASYNHNRRVHKRKYHGGEELHNKIERLYRAGKSYRYIKNTCNTSWSTIGFVKRARGLERNNYPSKEALQDRRKRRELLP